MNHRGHREIREIRVERVFIDTPKNVEISYSNSVTLKTRPSTGESKLQTLHPVREWKYSTIAHPVFPL